MRDTTPLLLGALFLFPLSPIVAQTKWDDAAARIVRVAPEGFAEVPPAVRSAFGRLGCTVPQAWGTAGLHNVISGSFARQGQTDWAALCSVQGSSAVHVIWGGDVSCPTPIEPPLSDRTFLQDTGIDGILFSRGIGRVRPDPRYWTGQPEYTADSVSHDAISDAFYEKGATAYYCRAGSWLEFIAGN